MSEPQSHPTPIAQFIIEARPQAVPSELAALPGPTHVGYSSDIAGWRESGTVPASELRARIEAVIARQGDGHFTITEAAQVLADAQGGSPEEHLDRMLAAWEAGNLPIHQGGLRYVRQLGESVCTFDDTVEVTELDRWLISETRSRFPAFADSGVNTSTADVPVAKGPVPDRGRRLKREALIAENVRRWPTIERNLKDAAKNGLSEAARDTSKLGWWWEGSAIEWARARAKLRDEARGQRDMNNSFIFHHLKD